MVGPYFDHPPLFGLVAAAYARAVGAVRGLVPLERADTPVEVYDIDLGRTRTLGLVLAALTMLLLFELGRAAFGYWPGLGLSRFTGSWLPQWFRTA